MVTGGKESYTQDANRPAARSSWRLVPLQGPRGVAHAHRTSASRAEAGRRGSLGACAAVWPPSPSLGGWGARRGGPRGKGEVRWPPPPGFVARRKMADVEEQLSDEEKVRAAGAAEPVGPGASRALASEPGGWRPAKGTGRCPRLPLPPSARCARVPAPVSHPRPARGHVSARPARPAPCRVCALEIGSGSGARRAGARGAARGDLRPGSGPRGPAPGWGAAKGVCGPACERPRALPSPTAMLRSVAGVKGERKKPFRKQILTSPF